MPGERLEQVHRPAPADPHAAAGMWSRYRLPLLAALPSGASGGALTAVGFQLDGLGEGVGAASVLATAALFAAVGALVAAVAAVGSILAVLLLRQRLRSRRQVGYGPIAAGAGVAVGGSTLVLGAVAGAAGSTGTTTLLVTALAAGSVSAVAADVVTALALRCRRLLP